MSGLFTLLALSEKGLILMVKSNKVEARKRARAAKARVDARRAERDAEISRVQTAFFLASAERDDAREVAEEAERSMAQVVNDLSDLDVRVEDIADLCEISAADVRAYKRRAVSEKGRSSNVADEAAPVVAVAAGSTS